MEGNRVKKITSLSLINTSEGMQLTYTYSVIDEESGKIVERNSRGEPFVVLNDEDKAKVSAVYALAEAKLV